VEFAQVPLGALAAEVLLGAVDHPQPLGDHLLPARRLDPAAGQFLEDPGVAERAAGDHHRVGARLLVGAARRGGAGEAAGDDHRDLEPVDQVAGEGVVGRALVAPGRGPRMEPDRRHPGLLGEPDRQVEAGAVTGPDPRAQLRRHRQAAALAGGAGEGEGELGVAQELDAGPGLAHLRHRAAHVDVDQVGARLGGERRPRAHHLGVVAEELHRDGVLVGVDPHQLAQGALVAVVEGEAGDHLRDRQPGPVPFRLQADEPVADPRQGRQQDPVGQPHTADLERVGERSPARTRRRWLFMNCAHGSTAGPSRSADRRPRRSSR
jgi:hypothetical protein